MVLCVCNVQMCSLWNIVALPCFQSIDIYRPCLSPAWTSGWMDGGGSKSTPSFSVTGSIHQSLSPSSHRRVSRIRTVVTRDDYWWCYYSTLLCVILLHRIANIESSPVWDTSRIETAYYWGHKLRSGRKCRKLVKIRYLPSGYCNSSAYIQYKYILTSKVVTMNASVNGVVKLTYPLIKCIIFYSLVYLGLAASYKAVGCLEYYSTCLEINDENGNKLTKWK